jgi:hypothetical protein
MIIQQVFDSIERNSVFNQLNSDKCNREFDPRCKSGPIAKGNTQNMFTTGQQF